MTDFGVETVVLDLPPLAATLGRRMRDAGLPVTPERDAEFARALDLVRPISRRRLYWTARSVFVTDTAQVKAFDRVFFAVFGGERSFDPDEVRTGPKDESDTEAGRTGSGEAGAGGTASPSPSRAR